LELGLRDFMRLFRRWWWLLLLAPIVTGFAARAASARLADEEPSEYEATATLLVNPIQSTGTPMYSPYTYGEILRSNAVIEPVITSLRLPYGPEDLKSRVTAKPVLTGDGRITELLTVIVHETDPLRAADIANAIADSFVSYVEKQAVELVGPTRAALDKQIADTQDQIAARQREIQALEDDPGDEDLYTRDQLNSLWDSTNQLKRLLSDLLQTAQEMDTAAAAAGTRVTVLDRAVPPTDPIASGELRLVPLAAFAGLGLAVASILLLAYLDRTVNAEVDFEALTGGPLLSVIPRVPKLRSGYQQLFVLQRPNTEAAESVRLLRTNIEFATGERKARSLAVSSSAPGDGKSTVTANLAAAMAQAGLIVTIIDGDLRNPSQHKIFGISNRWGLTTLLTQQDTSWSSVAVATAVPGLSIIPTGPAVSNPGDILSTDRLPHIIQELCQKVDVVLVDTPPIHGPSDALVISANVDAVILVGRSGRTEFDALASAAAALQRGAVRVIGVVLDSESRRVTNFYPYQRYPDRSRQSPSPTENVHHYEWSGDRELVRAVQGSGRDHFVESTRDNFAVNGAAHHRSASWMGRSDRIPESGPRL
jgi:capsular exopolysaccharide synthesis family protein